MTLPVYQVDSRNIIIGLKEDLFLINCGWNAIT